MLTAQLYFPGDEHNDDDIASAVKPELMLDAAGRQRDGTQRSPTTSCSIPSGADVLFHVRMDVHLPADLDPAGASRSVGREKAYSQELQRAGKWPHIWRVVGEYANFSIFDVEPQRRTARAAFGTAAVPLHGHSA